MLVDLFLTTMNGIVPVLRVFYDSNAWTISNDYVQLSYYMYKYEHHIA